MRWTRAADIAAGAAWDLLLAAFGLTATDHAWLRENFELTKYELLRQDDNGNEFRIETTRGRADALHKVRVFTDRGRKQLYWARPVGQDR
jgi:hypothetical protein